jgi:hypothetical protein
LSENVYRDAYEVLANAVRDMLSRELGFVENMSGPISKDLGAAPETLLIDAERVGLLLLYVGSAQSLRKLANLVETLDQGIEAGDINCRD